MELNCEWPELTWLPSMYVRAVQHLLDRVLHEAQRKTLHGALGSHHRLVCFA